MVDQIKSIISNATKSVSNKTDSSSSSSKSSSSAKGSAASDSQKSNLDTNISKFIGKAQVKEMASEPPIDKQNISRIKSAIANGSYPVDLDKIADALMDAYKEMK
ncbi:MAG: flagellar biosynthesis anti-sigma factor FlgM [Rickettsiales bacterium TMED254]|nr:flagellar biosynthesis anti-sigma factor FlgM [Rickettsiales bacterium]RPF77065.1 MAG: flagellar biosynthesis anti-sigma factor FlgM [Rickettsiales bacterium TMED254]